MDAHVHPLPVRRRRPAEVRDHGARDRRVRDQHQVAVLRGDRRGAPAHLADAADDRRRAVADVDPVADLEVTLQLQRQARHHVAQRVLQGEAEHGRRQHRRREHARHVDVRAGQHDRGHDEVRDPLHQVLQDARDVTPPERDVEHQQAARDDDREAEQQHRQHAQPVVLGRRWASAGAARRTPVAITRYAPVKKMPALTRPRSAASTTGRKKERTTSSAMATAGSGQAAAHSCAR